MSKVEVHYDTQTGDGHVMVDGKKHKDVRNVYLSLKNPKDRYDKSRIEISKHTPGEDGDLSESHHLTASAGQHLIDNSDPIGQKQEGLTYNYLGIPVKDPTATLAEAIENLFAKQPVLMTTQLVNPQGVPHVVVDK